MRSLLKGFFSVIFFIGLLGAMHSPALAVSGDGGVAAFPDGKPMANVKVRITQRNPDGSETTTERDTNAFGMFWLPATGGAITKVEIGEGGSIYTFDQSLNTLPERGGLRLPGTTSGDVITDFNVAKADSTSPGFFPSSGVWVTGTNGGGADFPRYKGSINLGYSSAYMKTMLDRDGTVSKGGDINVSQPEIRFDGRVYLGPLMNLGYFGNLGNLGNLRNFLFFGDVGNIGSVGLSNPFVGLQVGIGLGQSDQGLNRIEHSSNDIDTYIKLRRKYFIRPTVGITVADFNEFGTIGLQTGINIGVWDREFVTDESFGSGMYERTQQDDATVGAAFGVEYTNSFAYGNLGNGGVLGNLGNAVHGGFQMSYWTEYVPSFDIRKTTPNGNYIASVESAWVSTFYAGWGMYF